MKNAMPRTGWIVLLGCSLAPGLGGCGSGGEPDPDIPRVVLHLDPRLEDGASSAETLGRERRVLSRVVTEDVDALHSGGWRESFAAIHKLPGGEGLVFRGNVPDGGAAKRVVLTLESGFDASNFDVLELDVAHVDRGVTRVTWESGGDTPRLGQSDRRIAIPHGEVGAEGATIRVPLSTHPLWSGGIRGLAVQPNETGKQRFVLREMRLVREGFAMGPDALSEDIEPRPAGDGGLIAVGRDARRTWPTDWNIPLVEANLDLPERARLEAEWSLPTPLRGTRQELRLSCDVLPLGALEWETVESSKVVHDPGDPALWHPFQADLSDWAGGRVDLRLRCETLDFDFEDDVAQLERARFFWASPRVIGLAPDRAPRPSVFLITLDTTRADAVFGLDEQVAASRTPNLTRLRSESYVFTNTWTACNLTTPSHASIFTGLGLQDHGLLDNFSMLAPENATLAEIFRAQGYETAAAVSVEHLQTGNSGLGQGFDRFLVCDHTARFDGGGTMDRVLDWLDEWENDGNRPVFLWVHLFDPHAPYLPPGDFTSEYARRSGNSPPPKHVAVPTLSHVKHSGPGMFLEGVNNADYVRWMYDSGVAYGDELIGRFWDRAVDHGLDTTSLFMVTSDHGESLGERDVWCSHSTVHSRVMEVPLLMRPPGGVPGEEIDALAWTLDIAPTLLDFAGLRGPGILRGTNLERVRSGDVPPDRRIWFEHADQVQVGSVGERFWYLHTLEDYYVLGRDRVSPSGTRQIYDRGLDPDLEQDVAGEHPEVVSEYDRAFEAYRASAVARRGVARTMTPEDLEVLRELGYLEPGDEPGDEPSAEPADDSGEEHP